MAKGTRPAMARHLQGQNIRDQEIAKAKATAIAPQKVRSYPVLNILEINW